MSSAHDPAIRTVQFLAVLMDLARRARQVQSDNETTLFHSPCDIQNTK